MIKQEFLTYVNHLKKIIETQVQIATKARACKYDPHDTIEASLTYSSKEKILNILKIPKLETYIPKNLSHHENIILLAAEIAKQIVNGRFIKKSREELILLALHSTLVILSKGLISVPHESIPKVTIGNKTNHLTIYFSNTIRNVSGEIIGLVMLISDYIRHILHLNKFSASNQHVYRYIEEMKIFLEINDRRENLNEELIKLIVQNIGIEMSGESYDRLEVKKYRNLPNITNQLRTGMCVAFEKVIDSINIIAQQRISSGIPEWEWLRYPVKVDSKEKKEYNLDEARGTQPIIAKSRKPGGFRLRYGSSRITGQGAAGIHPATMFLTKMLSPGTTIKIDFIDRPLTIYPIAHIMGPLIELTDGSTIRAGSLSDLKKIEESISFIWELGDIIISPDDIPSRETVELSAWTEEWWSKEIQQALISKLDLIENIESFIGVDLEELNIFLSDPFKNIPSLETALRLTNLTSVPLHPYYSFNWNEMAISEIIKLIQIINESENGILPHNDDLKKILRQLGVPFKISDESIHSEQFKPFLAKLKGKESQLTNILSKKGELIEIESLIYSLSGIKVRSLCNRRIGLKIIRVEKAEPRHINPPANILFPIGSHGGTQRDLLLASKEAEVEIQLSERFCTLCQSDTFFSFCPECRQGTVQRYVCKEGHQSDKEICTTCGQFGFTRRFKPVNISSLLETGFKKTGISTLEKIKGVAYLNSKKRIPEHMIKGILRSKYDLFVYKDGTTRFDQTNAFLTHFTPKEINTSVNDLIQLGYSHDVFGYELHNENQIIELFPYDVIVSKLAGSYLVKLANMIDDELDSLYKLSPYYRINSLDNIIGSLIVGLASFSSVAIVGRIIGYTDHNVLFAHPLWHQLKARNCNGDVDSITLLLDAFINFSTEFIPASRGGTMDIPSIVHLPDEWEDILAFAAYESLPLNLIFYQSLRNNPMKEELLCYTKSYLTPNFKTYIPVDNISQYKLKNQFKEGKIISKVEVALNSLRRIRGIKEEEFVNGVLENDFLIKISSSFDRFFLQPTRCKRCKTTFRRVPLSKSCPICHNETLGLTLSVGWVLRYFQIINQLKEQYDQKISDYSRSWFDLIEVNKQLFFDKIPRLETLLDD